MAKITSLIEMKNYVLIQLGYPVINIEISDNQLEQAIEDTIQDVQRYLFDEATYRDYFLFQTSAGIQDYHVSAVRDYRTGASLNNVVAVWDFSVSFGADGINTLFSPQHILLYNQYVNQGSYPGGPNQGGCGLVLAGYESAMQYLEMINEKFGKMYTVDYIPGQEILRVTPTPNQALIGVLIIWRAEAAQNLYNHPFVKKIAVARAGQRWCRNLSKYNGSLPDGLTINVEGYLSDYKEQEEKYIDRLYDESSPPDFFVA